MENNDYIAKTQSGNINFPNGQDHLYYMGYKDGSEVAQAKKSTEDFELISFTEEKLKRIVNPEPYIRGYYDGMCNQLCLVPDEEFINSLISSKQK